MELEGTMLSENKSDKDKYCMTSLKHGIKKKFFLIKKSPQADR